MNFSQILTHPGGSHKDEFLACCLLLAENPVSIVRREPTDADLADLSIAVVDVGHEHDPARGNFDHHQFPKDHPPTCSLSLVLQHLGVYEDARKFCDWLEPAEWFDTRGPIETARWLGVERETLFKLNSPIDTTLLRRFAAVTALAPGEPLWEIMRWIGQDLLDYLKNLRQRRTRLSRPPGPGLRPVPPQRPPGARFHPHRGLRGRPLRPCPRLRRENLGDRPGAAAGAFGQIVGLTRRFEIIP